MLCVVFQNGRAVDGSNIKMKYSKSLAVKSNLSLGWRARRPNFNFLLSYPHLTRLRSARHLRGTKYPYRRFGHYRNSCKMHLESIPGWVQPSRKSFVAFGAMLHHAPSFSSVADEPQTTFLVHEPHITTSRYLPSSYYLSPP